MHFCKRHSFEIKYPGNIKEAIMSLAGLDGLVIVLLVAVLMGAMRYWKSIAKIPTRIKELMTNLK